MLGKIQGMFTKVRHNFNTMNTNPPTTATTGNNDDRRQSHPPPPRAFNAPSPRQHQPYRASMTAANVPNPLANAPTSPRMRPNASSGAAQQQRPQHQQHPQQQSQASGSLLPPLGQYSFRGGEAEDTPQPSDVAHAVHNRREQTPQQEEPRPEKIEVTPAKPSEETLDAPQQNQEQQQPTSLPAVVPAPAQRHTGRPRSGAEYSTLQRIAADYGLVMDGSSSGDYYSRCEAQPSDPTPEIMTPLRPCRPSPPAAPPATEAAVKASIISAPMSEWSRESSTAGGQQYATVFDYSARVSTEYETMQDGHLMATDDYGEVIGLLMQGSTSATTASTDAAHQGHSLVDAAGTAPAAGPRPAIPLPPPTSAAPPTAAAVKRPQGSAQFSMVRGPTRRNRPLSTAATTATRRRTSDELSRNSSSGDYEDVGYTYMNRPAQSTAGRRKDVAVPPTHSNNSHSHEEPSGTFASRIAQRVSAAAAAARNGSAQHDEELSHSDSSIGQLGPSTLRRANDLALSQWKYVALVVKKVAEKRTMVRESRMRSERRPSRVARADYSVLPLSRKASAKSADSLIFAPEEERPEEKSESDVEDDDEDLEVSVYDESGAPLLIPNLSDLFNELQSDADSDTSAVFDTAVASKSGSEGEAAVDENMDEVETMESVDGNPTPQYVAAHRPRPPTTGRTEGGGGGAFRRGGQQQQQYSGASPHAGQQYARVQDPRYRQKTMQHQRQQLLMQQQRMQNHAYTNNNNGQNSSNQQQQQQQRPSYHPSYNGNGLPPTQYGNGNSNSMLSTTTVGTTGRPVPQPDIYFGPRLMGGRSRHADFTALTGIRLGDARVINSPVWSALEPPAR